MDVVLFCFHLCHGFGPWVLIVRFVFNSLGMCWFSLWGVACVTCVCGMVVCIVCFDFVV